MLKHMMLKRLYRLANELEGKSVYWKGRAEDKRKNRGDPKSRSPETCDEMACLYSEISKAIKYAITD